MVIFNFLAFWKMLFDIDTAWVFSKIISIPDKKYFSEKAIGYTAIYSINFFRMFPLVFVPTPLIWSCNVLFAMSKCWWCSISDDLSQGWELVNRFNHTSGVTAVTPTDRPKYPYDKNYMGHICQKYMWNIGNISLLNKCHIFVF